MAFELLLLNFSSTPPADIILFELFLLNFYSKFLNASARDRGLHTLIKITLFPSPTNVGSHSTPPSTPFETQHPHRHLFPFLQLMWDLTIHPPSGPNILVGHRPMSTTLWGSAFSLAHHSISSFDTICNRPNSPLVDVVLFELSLKVFKTGFHTLINNISFPSQPMWDLTPLL